MLDQHIADDKPRLTRAELEASSKRQEMTEHVFEGLSFTVFAARVFFRVDDEDLDRAKRASERIRAAAPRVPNASGGAAAAAAADAAAVEE